MAAPIYSILLITAVAYLLRFYNVQHVSNNFTSLAISCKTSKTINFYDRLATKKVNNYSGLFILTLLLSNDVQQNPGPCTNKIYQCGLCDAAVNWSDDGMCCDNCSIWHHASCMGLGAADYAHLNKSSVSWECFKCHYTNLDSFTFHSYSISDNSSNYYFPLSDASDLNSLPTSSIDHNHSS